MIKVKEPIRVMIIEDDPGDARLLEEYLRDAFGTRVCCETVPRLADAKERLSSNSFDVVLLDMMLPDSWGPDAVNDLLSVKADIPIVVTTNLKDPSSALQCLESGAQDYLNKSEITPELLERTVRYALERSTLQRSIRGERNRLQAILDSLPDGLYIVDRRYNIRYINSALKKEFGSPGELKCFEYIRGRTAPCEDCGVRAVFEGERVSWEYVSPFDRRYAVSSVPFVDSDGEMCALVIFRDITERSRMEEAIRLERDRAQVASRAKSAFLASMSHELRTPLNAIIGFARVLSRENFGKLNKTQKEHIRYILDSAEHLLRLINDVLDLSKIEAEKLTVSQKPFDLGRLLRSAVKLVADHAKKRNITFSVEIAPRLGRLKGDEVRVRQVVCNLLSNAVKFTEPGGEAGLEAHAEGDRAVITVWDTGIGIPPDKLEAIFDPFVQVSEGRTRTHDGTGLGLAISKRLVEMHGGTISVVSTPGKGSRFTVVLPGLEPAERSDAEEEEMEQTPLPSLGGKCILVAEDKESNAKMLEAMLIPTGCRVLMAKDGAEAVQLALKENPDLILMDVAMPVMDGAEAMRRIRAEHDNPMPIVALTAYAMEGDRKKLLDEGFDDYIPKPVADGDLAKVLTRFVCDDGGRNNG